MATSDLEQLQQQCLTLRQARQTLLLATQGEYPETSYAPFIEDEAGNFYIYISELASHTRNLLTSARLSVMFIAEESETRNLFARERLVFHCDAQEVARDSEVYELRLQQLQARFGQVVEMLRSLPDFHLFRLQPRDGQYVVGFGRAYQIDISSGRLQHIDETVLKGESAET